VKSLAVLWVMRGAWVVYLFQYRHPPLATAP
jgi:hypothetical protein